MMKIMTDQAGSRLILSWQMKGEQIIRTSHFANMAEWEGFLGYVYDPKGNATGDPLDDHRPATKGDVLWVKQVTA